MKLVTVLLDHSIVICDLICEKGPFLSKVKFIMDKKSADFNIITNSS